MTLILKWLASTLAVMFTSYLLPGVTLTGFWAGALTALFLGLINSVIKPLLILLTLPINIITLGLFTFVINALLILLASSVIPGFFVEGFWVAMFFSIILSLFNYLLNGLFSKES
jgi:putative membrane protein